MQQFKLTFQLNLGTMEIFHGRLVRIFEVPFDKLTNDR